MAELTTTISNSSSAKGRQYSHLSSILQQLQQHVTVLDSYLRTAAEQTEYVKYLGGLQGGLFMAASRILGEEIDEATANAENSVIRNC